jgi:hypothetical protein
VDLIPISRQLLPLEMRRDLILPSIEASIESDDNIQRIISLLFGVLRVWTATLGFRRAVHRAVQLVDDAIHDLIQSHRFDEERDTVDRVGSGLAGEGRFG